MVFCAGPMRSGPIKSSPAFFDRSTPCRSPAVNGLSLRVSVTARGAQARPPFVIGYPTSITAAEQPPDEPDEEDSDQRPAVGQPDEADLGDCCSADNGEERAAHLGEPVLDTGTNEQPPGQSHAKASTTIGQYSGLRQLQQARNPPPVMPALLRLVAANARCSVAGLTLSTTSSQPNECQNLIAIMAPCLPSRTTHSIR